MEKIKVGVKDLLTARSPFSLKDDSKNTRELLALTVRYLKQTDNSVNF